MSETMALPPFTDASAKKTPTVYFIDDSATMREVIKIAFRRESINVITCADAASALGQFEQNPPDAVITDVIMPDQDGYSVCTQIKQHEKFSHIPVILMSGVVNKTVADKAVSVKADELIRKPFQPQELIGRVKTLLNPKSATAPSAASERPNLPGLSQPPAPSHPPASLSSFFAPPSSQAPAAHALHSNPHPAAVHPTTPESAWPRALADAFTPGPVFANPPAQKIQPSQPPNSAQPAYPSHSGQPLHGFPGQQQNPGYPSHPAQPPAQSPRPASPDASKLRAEIARLDLLVKKLQTELQIERQYNQALEAQLQALTRSE
jgi:twitching motility two-component system response regulator PilH